MQQCTKRAGKKPIKQRLPHHALNRQFQYSDPRRRSNQVYSNATTTCSWPEDLAFTRFHIRFAVQPSWATLNECVLPNNDTRQHIQSHAGLHLYVFTSECHNPSFYLQASCTTIINFEGGWNRLKITSTFATLSTCGQSDKYLILPKWSASMHLNVIGLSLELSVQWMMSRLTNGIFDIVSASFCIIRVGFRFISVLSKVNSASLWMPSLRSHFSVPCRVKFLILQFTLKRSSDCAVIWMTSMWSTQAKHWKL